ncbi:MAG: 4-alpha-glucanotransferase [Candidatus Azobacteroides sp.]|nr:4-alpha-glucanotransferase [Candidatus Azobacteroides sp.]
MKINFTINYRTLWGQKLYIYGSIPSLGEWNKTKAVEMEYVDNGNWSMQLTISPVVHSFEYRYFIKDEQGNLTEEWGKNRIFVQAPNSTSYNMIDSWQPQPFDKSFYSSVFTKNLFLHEGKKKTPPVAPSLLTIKVFAPRVEKHQGVAISGNQKELNDWDPIAPVMMNCTTAPEWEIDLDASKLHFPLEFKFMIVDQKTRSIVSWETGPNRQIQSSGKEKNRNTVVSGLYFNDNLPHWKGAGVAIPVFSLRSEESYGVGDFDDLKKMADWAKAAGLKMIQILPINDTTIRHDWHDSYPYRAISIYALHPMYLSLKGLGELKDKKKMDAFKKMQIELNKKTEVDYEAVDRVKWDYLKEIFNQNKDEILTGEPFLAFFRKNEEWLVPYAAFCHFRDKYQTADFKTWKTHSVFNRKEIQEYCGKNYDQVSIYYYLQYQLDKQLYEAGQYAAKQGVALKGDIPIGIGRESVDVWTEPGLFNLAGQAGAPPDDFSAAGQNWGFPTYNWEAMEKDGFRWWMKRFGKMGDFFEAYRIDHILGFFRIWEIPLHSVQGLLGQFNPALPFSREELAGYGLQMNEERFLKPYIREHFLIDFFGEYSNEVTDIFLDEKYSGFYNLKKEFDTQQKIEAYFSGKDDEKSIRIRDGLFGLTNEVLFLRDNKEPEKFHPRITAQYTYSYRELNDFGRWAFNRLYNDFYYHRHNEFWKEQALKKLPALIDSSDMLVCAEDLGMIPHCVPEVMNRLQMLSLEVQRMPKDPAIEFGNPDHYPYLSVCTTSSHDMSTLRGWWEENRDATQRYFNQILCEPGPAPAFCEPWICEKILMHHLYSPSMWAVFPLQDWLSVDYDLRRENPQEERINIPADPNHYWRYRMHLSIEKLMKQNLFTDKVKKMIENSGRV